MKRQLLAILNTLLPSRERAGLLSVLLLLGSTGLRAQTSDPFPEVNPHDFYGNMMLTVKVTASGLVLEKDVTVAVFAGDEIRGKGSPQDESNPGVAYITVYGNRTGETLTFKVWAKGVLVEPETVLTYTFNSIVGTMQEPYILDISAYVPYSGFTIDDAYGLRTAVFDGVSDETVSIPLPFKVDNVEYNRTFTPGQPAAIILPFDINGSMNIIGGKFYIFDKVEFEGPKWVVTMQQTAILEANMPYVVMPEQEQLYFDFGGHPLVMMTEAKTPNTRNGWTFQGTYEKIEWDEPGADYGFTAINQNHEQHDFVRFSNGDFILPLHCYLSYVGEHAPETAPSRSLEAVPYLVPDDDHPLPETIELRLVDLDGSTGVATLSLKDTNGNGEAFTLDGRRLVTKSGTLRLLIKNHKKILVK